MQRFFTLCVSLFLFCTFFLSLNSYSQSCNGFDGGPIAGGLTQLTNGERCANKGIDPGQMRIDAFNVDDGGNPNNVGFEIDWNDGSAFQIVTFTGGQVTHPAANAY